jgi:ubiquinone/menaquinone biosynthesis C-methylase UbiE
VNSIYRISRRWRLAQQSEAKGWREFGPSPRHFTRDYWNWEMGFLGISMDYLSNSFVSTVLEVGGGPFGMIHFINTKGIKINIEPLAVYLKRIGFASEQKDVLQIAAFGEAIPLADESVDIIICFNVLDHVAMPEKVLNECKRVLRPKGTLLFNVNVIHPLLSPLRSILSRMDSSHPFHWNSDEVLRIMDNCGLNIVFKSCLPRKNYKFFFLNFLMPRRKNSCLPISTAYLRIGENKYIPAKGSVLKHIGSNFMHMRLDLRAQKRGSP